MARHTRRGQPPCVHCGGPVQLPPRGRGLCLACHADRAVRDLYPRKQERTAHDPDVTEAELDATIAEQRLCLPAWYRREERPAGASRPRAADFWLQKTTLYRGEEDPPNWAEWLRDHGDGYDLHPDTEPGAIAAAQREAVRAAIEQLGEGWTVAAVSEAAVLPAWTVTRRLAELGVL